MLLDGFIVLTQDQLNMLALGAEPFQVSWDQPAPLCTGYPVLIAPEWPDKLELETWTAFELEGSLYAFQPEVIKASLERALQESAFFPRPIVSEYASLGLFQQTKYPLITGVM